MSSGQRGLHLQYHANYEILAQQMYELGLG